MKDPAGWSKAHGGAVASGGVGCGRSRGGRDCGRRRQCRALCGAGGGRERAPRCSMLEAAPEEESGGNSRFTAGAIRVVYQRRRRHQDAACRTSRRRKSRARDFGTYTAAQFFDDMARVTQASRRPRSGRALGRATALRRSTGCASKGVRFIPIYGRQAFKIDGKFKFWGGLTVEAVGGGPGLVAMLTDAARKHGIEIRYRDARARSPFDGDGGSRACACARTARCANCARSRWCSPAAASKPIRNGARATLGPAGTSPRCAARVSTPATAFAWRSISAPRRRGNWSGCHAVQWEMNAPEFGDLAVGDQFQKHSYPFGILINANGKRFLDEGADFRNYTYAKYGRVVLEQPGQFAWQVFDRQGEASAARRIPDPADHQGDGRTPSRNLRKSSKA